jgi:hypothetical protein
MKTQTDLLARSELCGGPKPDQVRALWSAVLLTALKDACLGGGRAGGDHAHHTADAWIRAGGADFRDVCDAAGQCPEVVRARYLGGEISASDFNSSRSAGGYLVA